MGSDNPEVASHESVPAVEGTPVCPRCSYDLCGLLEGARVTCPECGGSFTRAELAVQRASWLRREIDPRRLMVVIPIAGVVILGWSYDLEPGAGPCLLWVLALIWLVAELGRGHARPIRSLGVAAAVCMLSIQAYGYSYRGATELTVRGVLAVNAMGAGVMAIGWLLPPRASVAVALGIIALVPGIAGMAMLLSAAQSYLQADFWTYWKDPRARPGDIWPMLRWDAAAIGAKLLGVAAIVWAIALVVGTCRRRLRAAPLLCAGAPDQRGDGLRIP